MVGADQRLMFSFGFAPTAARLLAAQGDSGGTIQSDRASLAIIYSYGDFTAATSYVRSDDPAAAPIEMTRASCVPSNAVEAFFKNPLGRS